MRFHLTLISKLETNEETKGEKTKNLKEDGKGSKHALYIPHVLRMSPTERINIPSLHNFPAACEREEVVQQQRPCHSC